MICGSVHRVRVPAVQLVPVNRPFQPLPERHPGLKSELTFCPAYVKTPFWLAVRFRPVPVYLSFVSCQFGDKLYKLLYGNLHTGPQIHRLRFVVVFGSKDKPPRGIVETREGAKGGVRMARPAQEVRVLDVFEAMENRRPVFQTDLSFRVTGEIPDRAKLAIRSVFDDAASALRHSLDGRTIADLVARLDG